MILRSSCVPFTAAVLLCGCGPSPQPLPPPIDIVRSGLTVSDAGGGMVTIAGAPGAVTSALQIDVLNSGSSSGAFVSGVFPVAQDGSFSAQLSGTVADVFRLQALGEGARSVPLDVAEQGNGSVGAPPRVDCLVTAPDGEIDFGVVPVGSGPSTVTLTLQNDCPGITSFDGSDLLIGAQWDHSADMLVPTDMMSGAGLSDDISFVPSVAGAFTNYLRMLLVDASMQREFRIVTLHATAE